MALAGGDEQVSVEPASVLIIVAMGAIEEKEKRTDDKVNIDV